MWPAWFISPKLFGKEEMAVFIILTFEWLKLVNLHDIEYHVECHVESHAYFTVVHHWRVIHNKKLNTDDMHNARKIMRKIHDEETLRCIGELFRMRSTQVYEFLILKWFELQMNNDYASLCKYIRVGIKRWNWIAETETESGNWNGDKTPKWG
jgi:hypothetical protein